MNAQNEYYKKTKMEREEYVLAATWAFKVAISRHGLNSVTAQQLKSPVFLWWQYIAWALAPPSSHATNHPWRQLMKQLFPPNTIQTVQDSSKSLTFDLF